MVVSNASNISQLFSVFLKFNIKLFSYRLWILRCLFLNKVIGLLITFEYIYKRNSLHVDFI